MRNLLQNGIRNTLSVVLIIYATLVSAAFADYSISWYTIDGGGGYSSGGPYEMVGTAGQPDAGVSAGGDYVLNGGYWAGTCGCVVNMTDLSNFITQWLYSGPDLEADLWADEVVNLEDFAELAFWWLQACPADWPLK